MTTDAPAIIQDVAVAAYEIFMWPGTWLLAWFAEHAPGLALTHGDDGVALPAMLSGIVWSLLVFLVFQVIRTICLNALYGARRVNMYVTSRLQVRERRRLLSEPVAIPEVDFDELDIAVLNLGSTIPPGLGLTAEELSGQLTKRPRQVQESLEKLKQYGLVDDGAAAAGGFRNYCLTRSGAALLAMWQRQGIVPRPA